MSIKAVILQENFLLGWLFCVLSIGFLVQQFCAFVILSVLFLWLLAWKEWKIIGWKDNCSALHVQIYSYLQLLFDMHTIVLLCIVYRNIILFVGLDSTAVLTFCASLFPISRILQLVYSRSPNLSLSVVSMEIPCPKYSQLYLLRSPALALSCIQDPLHKLFLLFSLNSLKCIHWELLP